MLTHKLNSSNAGTAAASAPPSLSPAMSLGEWILIFAQEIQSESIQHYSIFKDSRHSFELHKAALCQAIAEEFAHC